MGSAPDNAKDSEICDKFRALQWGPDKGIEGSAITISIEKTICKEPLILVLFDNEVTNTRTLTDRPPTPPLESSKTIVTLTARVPEISANGVNPVNNQVRVKLSHCGTVLELGVFTYITGEENDDEWFDNYVQVPEDSIFVDGRSNDMPPPVIIRRRIIFNNNGERFLFNPLWLRSARGVERRLTIPALSENPNHNHTAPKTPQDILPLIRYNEQVNHANAILSPHSEKSVQTLQLESCQKTVKEQPTALKSKLPPPLPSIPSSIPRKQIEIIGDLNSVLKYRFFRELTCGQRWIRFYRVNDKETEDTTTMKYAFEVNAPKKKPDRLSILFIKNENGTFFKPADCVNLVEALFEAKFTAKDTQRVRSYLYKYHPVHIEEQEFYRWYVLPRILSKVQFPN